MIRAFTIERGTLHASALGTTPKPEPRKPTLWHRTQDLFCGCVRRKQTEVVPIYISAPYRMGPPRE